MSVHNKHILLAKSTSEPIYTTSKTGAVELQFDKMALDCVFSWPKGVTLYNMAVFITFYQLHENISLSDQLYIQSNTNI